MDYLEDWDRDQKARVREWRRRASAVEKQMSEIDVRATSPNGEVSVTVDAGGAVTNVRFTPQNSRLSHTQLSAIVLETLQRAQNEAKRQVHRAQQSLLDDAKVRNTIDELQALLGNESSRGGWS